jgi:NAD(P)-dependent dehydrogenase (short-subunit alcohol dehydrogenase family)
MAPWTTVDIPDQHGVTAVVTGSNSGIGFIAARELARAGATTVMACRNPQKASDAEAKLRADVPEADLTVLPLDLADLSSVRAFAADLGKRYDGLDLLVNNAGVMAIPHRTTADGFEMQLGTNHLGHFALTGLVLDQLRSRQHPRVVTISSGAHRRGSINFDDLQSERRYSTWGAYMQSKLANLLFMYELHRRTEAAGLALRSVGAHPGYASTNLQFVGPQMAGNRLVGALSSGMMSIGNAILGQSDEMGALPTLYAATTPDLPGGSYVGPDGWMELHGHPTLVKSSRNARDPETARRLWEASEQLTDVHYQF